MSNNGHSTGKMWQYTTIQGDTWDVLAHDIYGNQHLAWVLLQANPEHMGVVYFPAGVSLRVPKINTKTATKSPKPPWA